MKLQGWIAAIACSTALFAACKKDPIAGKGGNAVLKITPRHHGNNIDSCTVYIKYNTKDLPADAKYDDSAKCAPVDGKPVATFSNLKKGDYYLYGSGWDPSIAEGVLGGTPYTISEEISQSYNLSVTEGD
jgi:hypothetical protein